MSNMLLAGNIQSQFKYQPLPERSSIRLLELQSGHWDDPLQCALLIVHLDRPTFSYEAISYAWADSIGRERILCNGVHDSITKSLFDALRAFRRRPGEKARILWADDICIDQSNVEERSQQVQLMQRIYRSASKVLIWVGHDSAADIQAGFDLICHIASKEIAELEKTHPSDPTESGNKYPESYYKWRATTSSEPHEKRSPNSSLNAETLSPLCALFSRKWFTRLWVIQELALSCAADLYWGDGSIDFVLVGRAAVHVLDNHKTQFVQHEAFDGLKKCYTMFGIWTNRWADLSFFDMLWLTRGFQASDAKDKIFGMLGLTTSDSDPDGMLFMDPDYTLTKAEVYSYVANKILVQQKEVDMLATVQHGCQVPDDWPSWVPDWAVRHTSYLCNGDRTTSGGAQQDVKVDASSGRIPHMVSILGIVVDNVTTSVVGDFDTEFSWWHPNLAKSLTTFIQEMGSEFSDSTLAYTLTAGLGPHGYLVDDDKTFIDDYTAFKDWDFEQYATMTKPVTRGLSQQDDNRVQAGYRFFANSGPTVLKRRCFKTRSGMLGLGPIATAEGDTIAILFGGTVPYVLRPTADKQRYKLVGECYVHDVMDGQAVAKWQESGEPAVDFHIY